MSVCPIEVTPSGAYCARHKIFHSGRALQLSQLESEAGEKYRNFWDEKLTYVRYPKQVLEPYKVIKIDSDKLTPNRHQSNNSIIRYRNKNLMVYRTGWFFARLNICELDDNFNVVWNKRLHFDTDPLHADAQEDARFFVWKDELYFSYIGLTADKRGWCLTVNQLLAKLSKDFKVEYFWYPHYSDRQTQEKNWQFFEYDNKLLSVYSVNPHTILEINNELANIEYQTENRLPKIWQRGFLRGGANPVLFQNEFYSFFHWVEIPPPGIPKSYTIGVYTFEAKPPFRITRISNGSILANKDEHRPCDWHMNTTFPCGAYIKDDSWYISYGSYDSWCSLALFKINEVEKAMSRVI